MSDRVRITDVSPRDGLQNEPGLIATADKVRLIRLLATTGVDEIEATSFVSPKWVPQLGDAAEVLSVLAADWTTLAAGAGAGAAPLLSALVPNERGLEAALAANAAAGKPLIAKVSVFTAASETFARRNTNASIAETLDRFRPVVAHAHRAGLTVRGYLSCVIACPFEGRIAPAVVADWSGRLLDLGIDELDLGDTIGAGTAQTIRAMLEAVGRVSPLSGARVPVTLHLHDTFGHAAECVRAALDVGVRSFDGSVAGLGGCPYATKTLPDGSVQRAPGNISTELLVRTIHASGFTTGASPDALDHAAAQARLIVAAARGSGRGVGGGVSGGVPA